MKHIKSDDIKLEKLVLDINNPRFAELYTGSHKQDDLIEYLLYTESGEEIANGIKTAGGFYPDKPLWVLKEGDKFLVKDGNRRCAAVKALQFPEKYGLDLSKISFTKLPVLIYDNKNDLDKRILQEHTANLFKEWDRIAKALEVYKLYTSGSSIESMKEIDSSPRELIKLASFYYEAVKIGEEDLKKLLRRGRGKTGGKTIIFERLFKFNESCGYKFKKKPSYEINVIDEEKFTKYISALIEYLKSNPSTTHKIIDKVQLKDGSVYLYNEQYPKGYELPESYLATDITTLGFNDEILELASNEYYMLGDNRPVSKDSRSIGPIQTDLINGKVWFKGGEK